MKKLPENERKKAVTVWLTPEQHEAFKLLGASKFLQRMIEGIIHPRKD